MKRNVGKYENVSKLPKNAATVTEFAKKMGISQSYVYKMIERKTANFKIVIFQTINFVIPKK